MRAKPGDIVRACIPGKPEVDGLYLRNVRLYLEGTQKPHFDPQAELLLFSGEFYTCHPSWLRPHETR